MNNLEILVQAYMKTVELWASATPGYSCGMVARAMAFLQKRIKTELEKS